MSAPRHTPAPSGGAATTDSSPAIDTSPATGASGEVGGQNATDDAMPAVPFLRVERGAPTAEELAAITVTLAAVASASTHSASAARSDRSSRRSGVRWGSTWHSLNPGWARGRGWIGW